MVQILVRLIDPCLTFLVILAKTAEPHPKLPGTIYTAEKEIEEAGGKALPIICDVRNEEQVNN